MERRLPPIQTSGEDRKYHLIKLDNLFSGSPLSHENGLILNLLQMQHCIWLMNRADIKRARRPISMKAIAGGLIALLGVGMLIGQSFQTPVT
ncbi:MAG: hypothetical protein V7K47_26460 [Nostoc sp.]